MIHSNERRALIATLVLVSMTAASVFAAPAGGVGSAAAAPTASSPHGGTANYTFSPDEHAPGHEDGAVNHFASGLEEDLSALHYVVIRSEEFDFADCSAQKTEAFGIDRGNDDPGTETDESLLTAYKNIEFNSDSIVVEFYKEDALAGQPKAISTEDQIVARGVDCYDNPDEAGWYQIDGMVNGSTESSDSPDTDYSISTKSHYIYVCDCDSRQEAVDKLGPPPSEQSDDGSSDGTPTAEATPEPTESDGGSDGGEKTATATPTSESGTDGSGDETASTTESTESDGDPAGTDTSTAAATDAGTASETVTDDGPAATDAGGGDGATPTQGGGPGFGLLAALGALVAAVAVARRRSD